MLAVLLAGCAKTLVGPIELTESSVADVGTLLLAPQDIAEIGLTPGGEAQTLEVLGLTSDNKYCKTETYETSENSPLAQLATCSYTIDGLENTSLIIEIKRFTNANDLTGTYQYESLHLRGAKGLLAENTFGDQSRFSVNSDDDYGAEFNPPGVSFYSLYFTKDSYLVHVTTKGSADAKEDVEAIGRRILAKFE